MAFSSHVFPAVSEMLSLKKNNNIGRLEAKQFSSPPLQNISDVKAADATCQLNINGLGLFVFCFFLQR